MCMKSSVMHGRKKSACTVPESFQGRLDKQWLQAWYQWRDQQLKAAVEEWVKSVL